MAKVIAGMTISVDGFTTDGSGSADRLYPDLGDLQDTDYMTSAIAETGAVVMGRRTFEMADPDSYVGAYEFQVPIFVVTHNPPGRPPAQDEHLTFTFADGADAAVVAAKAAAGPKAVQVVGGANVIQQLLVAGLVDELHLDVMPVLLGTGIRLLDRPELDGIELEKIGVDQVGARTTLKFRVLN